MYFSQGMNKKEAACMKLLFMPLVLASWLDEVLLLCACMQDSLVTASASHCEAHIKPFPKCPE